MSAVSHSQLIATGEEIAFEVRLYRDAGPRRAAVAALWEAAGALTTAVMQDRNRAD